MKKTIFREYDIRGIYPEEISPAVFSDIARAFYLYARKKNYPAKFLVGYDSRLSSPLLAESIVRTLKNLGATVLFAGLVPTPAVYWGLKKIGPEICGLMVTASHNPKEFNGLKLNLGLHSLFGPEIQKIYEICCNLPEDTRKIQTRSGKVIEYPLRQKYQDFLVSSFSVLKRFPLRDNFRIGVDSGNGTAGLIFPDVLKTLGLKFYSFYPEPDGNFPNHHPDPTVEKNLLALRQAIKKYNLQLGLAFDGDADRLGVIDKSGEIIYGDHLLYVFARSILKKNPGAKIISEVKCSSAVLKAIEKLGGKVTMGPTGHSRIKDMLWREKALLAGEMSGHFFFNDRKDSFGYDDAIYAALRLLEIVLVEKTELGLALKEIAPTAVSPEIRLFLPDEEKFATISKLQQIAQEKYPSARIVTIDGVRVEFTDGWFLARASNTQPALILRVEAKNEKLLKRYFAELKSLLEKVGIKNVSGKS